MMTFQDDDQDYLPKKIYEIEGKREIENHAYQIMKVGFPPGFPFWP